MLLRHNVFVKVRRSVPVPLIGNGEPRPAEIIAYRSRKVNAINIPYLPLQKLETVRLQSSGSLDPLR